MTAKFFAVLAAGILLITVLAVAADKWVDETHSCTSPCTVRFPSGSEEDEFAVDWKGGSLRVWKR